MSVGVDIIEPTGFAFSDGKMKRAGMDYIAQVVLVRHRDWKSFVESVPARIILLTTKGATSLYQHAFRADDVLLFGCESAGVPELVAARCDGRVRIPIASAARSLNLSVATGIAVAEALRQTGGLPE